MSIISTSPTVRRQPSPRFHVEAWLPFRNREIDYSAWAFKGTTVGRGGVKDAKII